MRKHATSEIATSSNRKLYLSMLRAHAHELLVMGYVRLDPSDLACNEEPDITGKLVSAMSEALEEDDAPDWADRYALKDDPPLNTPGRYGKRRPRVDIEFELVRRGPRPRLRFEAKRLGPRNPVSEYLGNDGLGCFIAGKYPMTHNEAGMLGYVQSGSEDLWATRISESLKKSPKKYSLKPLGQWQKVQLTKSYHHTYRTVHFGPNSGSDVAIHHVLLRCC